MKASNQVKGTMFVKNETLAPLKNYCLVRGIPLPKGKVFNEDDVVLIDEDNHPLPIGTKILQKRSDGSIEWLLTDILLNMKGEEEKTIYVVPGVKRKTPVIKNKVKVNENSNFLQLSNGLSEVIVNKKGGSILHKLVINGKEIIGENDLFDIEVIDLGGKIYRASLYGPYKVRITHQSEIRIEVMVEGKHKARDGETFLDFALRFTLTSGNPDLKIEHTFYCREPQETRIYVKAIKMKMDTRMMPDATKLLRQRHHGNNWFLREIELKENVELISSGLSNVEDYPKKYSDADAHIQCKRGTVFLRNEASLKENWREYPFYLRPGGTKYRGYELIYKEMWPILGWKEKGYTLVTTFEHFAQLHPKSILIDENTIIYSIWPEWSMPLMIMQGVSKSHIIWLTGEKRELKMYEIVDILGRWEYGYSEPVDFSFDPAWPAYCEVLDCQYFLKYQPEKYPLLENLIEPVPAAGNPKRHTYDRQLPIGMLHFGDIVSNTGTHLATDNNEDDKHILFPIQHFLRTGHTYAWDYAKEVARHYMEVDFREWSIYPDQKGGLIAHTDHHFIGSVYPSHQWTEGLLAYYYLSGDERAKNVVISCADNHIYWAYHKIEVVNCDEREAGRPLNNLAMAYKLTGDYKYIKAAKHIIKNFLLKWKKKYGTFKYPAPQGAKHPIKLREGYGDYDTYSGLYRLWEVTGEKGFKNLAIEVLKKKLSPEKFTVNDARFMDFFAVWALGKLTGDMDSVVENPVVKRAIPMLLRRGGHPLRRLHFLKELDERNMLDDRLVGNRAGVL